MLKKNDIRKILPSILQQKELENAIVIWDNRVYQKGEQLSSKQAGIRMPFAGTVVFIDLQPKANWAHPCLYLAFPQDYISSEKVQPKLLIQTFPASFPPSWYWRGDLPASACVLLRYGKQPEDSRVINPY